MGFLDAPSRATAAVTAQVNAQVPPLVAQAIASDPSVSSAAATMAQSTAGLVPKWKASTAYTTGQQVVAPNGDIVTAKASFTSGASYDGTKWTPSTSQQRGTLPNGTDLNTLTAQTDSGTWVLGSSNTYVNAPFTGAGQLWVAVSGAGSGEQRAIRYGFNDTYWRNIQNYFATPKTWRAWEKQGMSPAAIPSGASLDDYRTPGDYIIDNTTIANSITAGWPTQVARGPMWLRVRATSGGIVFQEGQTYGTGAALLFRATESIGTTPYPFGAWRSALGEAPPQVGLANSLRVDESSQRRGGRKKTGQRGAVALRFDHGLNNFDSVIRPLLEARNLPYSLALNSRNWLTAENSAVTAAMVDGWVAGGLCEVWNHGAHHNDATVYATQYDVIVTGLAELRAQIPSAKIDGWVVPGVTGTMYGGFNGGQTPEAFYTTDAGRLILENHAVSSGAYPNTSQRVLDGRVRQGMGHYTMEAQTTAATTAQIDAAISNKTGLQLMMHPSLINTAGNLTTAQLTTVLDYIVAKRSAGSLVVLGPYDLLLADAT